jgi:hypothetical protein
MRVDLATSHILERYLDDSDWYPEDEEYRGPDDLAVSVETLWAVLRRYHQERFDVARGTCERAEEDQVTALEALTCDRLLMQSLKDQRPYLVYDARKEGGSWADVGDALGVARQSAHEMYAEDLAERAEWWKGRIGADDFTKRRPEYESVLNEEQQEPPPTKSEANHVEPDSADHDRGQSDR